MEKIIIKLLKISYLLVTAHRTKKEIMSLLIQVR
jgi:hypothetical protein